MPRRRRAFDDGSFAQSNLVERGFCHALGKFGICFGGIWPALDRPRELRQRRRYDCSSFGIDLGAYRRVRPKTARNNRLSLRQFAAASQRQTVAFTLELQGSKGYTDLASVSVLVTTLGEKGTRCKSATAPATVSGECDRHMPLRPQMGHGKARSNNDPRVRRPAEVITLSKRGGRSGQRTIP